MNMAKSSIKLTELELHLFEEARRNQVKLLRSIKARKLTGAQVETMKVLEDAVQRLEVFQVSVG